MASVFPPHRRLRVRRLSTPANGRIRAADGLGVCGVDPASHDERTIKTVTQVFDGKIDLREAGGSPEIRISGLADQADGWHPLDVGSHLESAE